MLELAKAYNTSVQEEKDVPPEKLAVMNVGKIDAKRRLGAEMTTVMSSNITQVRYSHALLRLPARGEFFRAECCARACSAWRRCWTR